MVIIVWWSIIWDKFNLPQLNQNLIFSIIVKVKLVFNSIFSSKLFPIPLNSCGTSYKGIISSLLIKNLHHLFLLSDIIPYCILLNSQLQLNWCPLDHKKYQSAWLKFFHMPLSPLIKFLSMFSQIYYWMWTKQSNSTCLCTPFTKKSKYDMQYLQFLKSLCLVSRYNYI